MTKGAIKAFLNYSWPGNVSELINVIERFVIMVSDEAIKSSHLSLLVEPRELQYIPGVNRNQSLEQASAQFEKEYIHKSLIKNKWDLSKTASDLRIEVNQLNEKINDLGITFVG